MQLLRKRKNLKKNLVQPKNNITKPIKVGSFSDDLLTANVLVKDRNVTSGNSFRYKVLLLKTGPIIIFMFLEIIFMVEQLP